jgi:peptidoglycan LD-endopeptidase LytH
MTSTVGDSLSARLATLPAASPFDFDLSQRRALRLDLSAGNPTLRSLRTDDPVAFSAFIEHSLRAAGADYGWGGYGENRTLYGMSPLFDASDEPRTLHLGVDLWTAAGTPVHAVLDGHIHSFQDNARFGDYGPTIILEHRAAGEPFWMLYGHLARRSLAALSVGQHLRAGTRIGWLGVPEENLGWPPHLHVQVIRDLQGQAGDYPGVCRASQATEWLRRCPDPNLLLRIR